MSKTYELGRWILIRGELSHLKGNHQRGVLPAGFNLSTVTEEDLQQLSARGAKGFEDAKILESADIAVVTRDESGEIVNFGCCALSNFMHPAMNESIYVSQGEAFFYHEETGINRRGLGLARANLAFRLSIIQQKGVRSAFTHTTERTHTVRRYYRDFGFEEVGLLISASCRDQFYWITLADRQFFADDPLFSVNGLQVHQASSTDLWRIKKTLSQLVSEFDKNDTGIVIFGAGAAADELLKLVPGLESRIIGVVDNDPRLKGTKWRESKHTVLSPEQWANYGSQYLLYASKAFQSEMQAQHQAFGPDGSFGIRLYPSLEFVKVSSDTP